MKKTENVKLTGRTVALFFDRYEEKDALDKALNGDTYHLALWEISQNIFRPHRKHGYSDQELNKLTENKDVLKAIEILENMFYDILKDKNIEL